MVSIIEFPLQRARGAVLRKDIETTQTAAVHAPHPVTDSILALMEQVQRTSAAMFAYRAETEPRKK